MILEDLWIKHGAASFDKQIYLEVMLGKYGWGLDIATGVLAFRKPHEAPLQLNVQVIGTESDDDKTWLWAWANKEQGFKTELLMSSLEIKVFGDRAGIPELTMPGFPITPQLNGHRLSAIASGICRAGCYFRAPYPSGALYLLVRDPRFKRPVSQPIQRVLRAFPMFLSDNMIADQRAALLSYLDFYKLEVAESETRVEAVSKSKARTAAGLVPDNLLIAEFDANHRLIKLESALQP
jgi:hypothetical protein